MVTFFRNSLLIIISSFSLIFSQNHSLSFDGEDYVSLSSPIFSGVQNDFTISISIKPEEIQGWGAVYLHRAHNKDK